MYYIKRPIAFCFAAVAGLLELAGIFSVALVLGAQALALVEHPESYGLLQTVLSFEQRLTKPVFDVLRAAIPTAVVGFDVSPYILATGLIVFWILCNHERHRAQRLGWELDERRREARAAKKKAAEPAPLPARSTLQALEEQRRMDALAAEQERLRALAEEQTRLRAEAEARMAAEARRRAQAEAEAKRHAEALEQERKKAQELAAMPVIPAAGAVVGGLPQDVSQREQLLELYAQTKKSLEESKKNLSFLAVDVVNSTGMKLGEDPALAERDFRQYKKLVERVIAANKGLKAAWTPDGVMICFASVQNAVQAAQELIRSLDTFNRQVKTIKADFKVRCGINAGRVMWDETVRMEEMTDRNIDVAGHMQKYADANTIFVGAHAIEGMRAEFGFRPAQKTVDGHEVYEWRQGEAPETVAA